MPSKSWLFICCTMMAVVSLLCGCQTIVSLKNEVTRPVAMHEFTLDPSEDVVGTVQIIKVREDDTLSNIARRFNVGYEEIVNANPGVDPWLPMPGTEVVVPTAFVLPDVKREGIVINLAAMRLFYYPKTQGDEPQKVVTHPIGIGRVGWRTPEGNTTIVAKAEAPAWIPTPSIRREHAADGKPLPKVVPPGEDNPMGSHTLRLGWPKYAIHGTDKPPSIGLRGTHGCLRMYPEDIVGIYDAVPVGTPVTVVNQPFLVGWRGDTLMMQTYPVLEDDHRNHHQHTYQLINRMRKSAQGRQGARATVVVNKALVRVLTKHPQAIAVPITHENLTLQQYLEAAPRVKNGLPINATWNGDTSRQLTAADVEKLDN